ncbi:MAG: serine/threonine-protein kinase, partial [Acidobacteria bacterium]|nr:serine/threonine-protein kinase [Acidobacteriota bacterium]
MRPEFQVGQFVLERKIGEGGMAEVWLGRNVHLGSLAAVKFLNDQYAARKDIEERFLNEGRRHGALDHPNIVKVYGFDYAEGRSFLIMQFVDGEALDSLLQRTGPLTINQAWPLAHGILNALEFAHSRQIVHRDVKPSNVLIDRQGTAYLGDFGIVLAVNEKRLTQTGTVMGTPHYMSPEQISRPMELDHRSDIYSFGCLLYEMLTGATPFDHLSGTGGDTDFAVKTAHLQTPPPPLRQRNPAISPAVEQVVLRCLAKDPSHRFATCGQVREALTHAVYNRVEPPKRKTSPWPWLAGAAAFVVLALALAAFALWPEEPVVESFTAAPASIRQGKTTLLSWNVRDATEVEITGLGKRPATGLVPITPTAKTVYRLVGRNRWRTITRELEVDVTAIPPVEIRRFSISPDSVRPNETAKVSWEVTGATVVMIGGKQVTPSGEVEVRVRETSQYELVARGEDGKERREQRELKVDAPLVSAAAPEIIEFSFTPNVIRVGEPTTLRWNVRGA